jgi:nitroreductase
MLLQQMSTESLIAALRGRYATKIFDPSRKIPSHIWNTLEQALWLTPSSFGLQPWKFLVLQDESLRESLVEHSWNQAQPAQCSHFLVICVPDQIDETWIDRFLSRQAEIRGVEVESMSGFRKLLIASVVQGMDKEAQQQWAKDQAYIALGNFMTCAALLGVDTCPMEGFVPAEYDRVLNLKEKGLHAVVACAAGYRADSDKYSRALKVRFPLGEVFERY